MTRVVCVPRRWRTWWVAPIVVVAAVTACGSTGGRVAAGGAAATPTGGLGVSALPATGGAPAATGGAGSASRPPRPAHTVVVVLENRSYSQIIGNPAAPFLNALARRGAVFTDSHAVTHPSEPNYLALFSGSTQHVTDDSCPHRFRAPNLAADLLAAHDTFAGYAESLPHTGSEVCGSGAYARKHVPWTDFVNVPPAVNKPLTAFPAGRYAALPTVSFVIPNLCDDMHDCSVATGDRWMRAHIGPYAAWAATHDSLLIVTWDENDGSPGNRIPTILVGQMVRPGRYAEPITHYSVLRTIEDAYGLPHDGHAATAAAITGVWR